MRRILLASPTLLSALLACASFASVVGPASIAAADATVDAEVQRHFSVANKLYKELKYGDALGEYDEAYRLSGNYKILYNRAQCLVMLRREPEAIATFDRYLKDGGTQIDPDRRKEVEASLADLHQRLGKIKLSGVPAGYWVDIDGVRVFPSFQPGQQILAGAGEHTIVAGPQGTAPEAGRSAKVKVPSGEEVAVTLDFAAPNNNPPVPTYTPMPTYAPMPTYGPPVGTDVPMYPPRSPARPRPPGGLVSPSFMISLVLGGSAEAGSASSQPGGSHLFGAAEIGASWRPGSFFELGLFFAGASGQHGTGVSGTNADYTYSNYGLRLRLHPIRGKVIDGWFGFDFGGFHESWQVNNTTYSPTTTAFAIGLGADFPISRTWALGGAFRYLGTASPNCPSLDNACNSIVPGGARGYIEFGMRVVWSIPYGQHEEPVEKGSASTSPALRPDSFF